MNYNKSPLSISDQINLLESRGLIISDKNAATQILSNISYYRLRAYTYPYQDNSGAVHNFNTTISIEEIIEIYSFDRRIRILLFDAIEKIEVSIRTQIIYNWSMNHGSHWQSNINLYRDHSRANTLLQSLKNEIDRESETFIVHYKNKYTNPPEPPSWMSLEVSSFGLLSLIFLQLKKCPEKKIVSKYFGLNDISIMENWMHCLCNVRNICAHHGRLWNRRLTTHIKYPTNPINQFIMDQSAPPYKLYSALVIIRYFLNIINPDNAFNVELITLINSCSLVSEKEMGFPKNWCNEPFWM